MRQTLHSGRQVLRRRAFRRFWLLAPALRELGQARAIPGLSRT